MRQLLASTALLSALLPALACADADEPPAAPALLYPSCGRSALYLVSEIQLANTAEETERLTLDIDGDGTRDNELGKVRVAITSLADESSDWPQRAIESGDLEWLIEVEHCSDESSTPYWRLSSHQARDGRLTASGGYAAIGMEGDVARDGEALMPLSAFAELPGSPLGEVAWARGIGLAADARVDDQQLVATMAAGFKPTDVRAVVLPVLASGMTRIVAETEGCPSSCPDDSYAHAVVKLFDTDKDGQIELAELEESALVGALSKPDLDLMAPYQGQATYWPMRDLERDHLSLGLSIVAERITP